MTDNPAQFKRMMLSLPHSSGDYAAVSFTAELAALFGVDLLGIFAVDNSLARLAALPCVRELRPSGGWHPIDATEMEQSSGRAAAEAGRLFREAAKALPSGVRFDVVTEPITDIIGSRSTRHDIVVVIQPKNPAERISHQFTQLVNAACAAPSAALFIPNRVIRRHGPIVTIAANGSDASIRTALHVAELSHERLLVFVSPHANETTLAGIAAAAKVPVYWRHLPAGHVGPRELSEHLALIAERLVVVSRGGDPRTLAQLAFERAVPVLVTEPTHEATAVST